MKIIPAIDIIDGQCVRLSKGMFDTKKVYFDDPLEAAKAFEDVGIKFLHLIDLDGARNKTITNHKLLERIKNQTSLRIEFGGGLYSDHDIEIADQSGADQMIIGSMAIKNPELFLSWLNSYGNKRIILAADCINGKVAGSAWEEESELDLHDFIRSYQEKGVSSVLCTDISKDGMLEGASISLYQDILKYFKGSLIASGGVKDINDIIKLKAINCEAVVIGKAFYENRITLKQLQGLC